jgi:hypothetical protein
MKSLGGRKGSRPGKGSLGTRLARLEQEAARKKDPDPNATLIARMSAFEREVAPENQPIVAAFDAHFAATFPPVSVSPLEHDIVSWASGLTSVQSAAFRRLSKEMFAEWLADAFPGRPPRPDDRRTFDHEIDRLAHRMYLEVATNLVPRRQRQFYFDPDQFLAVTFRPDLWNPPRKLSVFTLKLLHRPSGDLLKRARSFTQIHARREGDGHDWMLMWKTGDTAPLNLHEHRYTKLAV